ncbi:MAG: carbamoyl-phosphate synthase large subunit [Alphaproteobacteria bacterium]
MPKRTDIDTVIIIGAGPIIIGQACEFDYSGTQACKALRDEGYRVVLINSNPATIMTDPDMADETYIEPITPEIVGKILEKERNAHPEARLALLPTMGGQTALNAALAVEQMGFLEKYSVEMIGAKADVIDKAEDRQRFREAMDKIGLESPKSVQVNTLEEALDALEHTGLPSIIRPSFTMGGTGGGIAYNRDEFVEIVKGGLDASPVNNVLVEESVLGWKEYEMEVVRDKDDNCIIICAIENIDPMGVHTGDSITVAPALTLTDREYQVMRNASIAVLREIGVETGGSNVQFAVNPDNGRLVVIEMNPRVSRSSALASKATGYPIAKIAAKLAVGYSLNELKNDITQTTPASFEPTIDYVVTKIPRFTFEKFANSTTTLTTSMKSVGEAMAIGRNFQESVQKALRSLETGLSGFDAVELPDDDSQAIGLIAMPQPERLLRVAQGFRRGFSVDQLHQATKIDPWFLRQIEEIIAKEKLVASAGLPKTRQDWIFLKQMGFSDQRLADLSHLDIEQVTAARHHHQVHPAYRLVDSCAAEFPSHTAYFYSSYVGTAFGEVNEAVISNRRKVIILGGGPNRIGQGIEFDYCCVHAAYALRDQDIETIMINCNPETVSTDYDTSDRLYFEPLTQEDVIEICIAEQKAGQLQGVIVQFGGQTPLKLAHALEQANIPILGTSTDAIDLAEDRERFQKLVEDCGLKQPPNGLATSKAQALKIADRIGYPVVIRPSYVLGGRAMEIVHDPSALERYIDQAVKVSGKNPVLIDYYLKDAIEIDADALSDGKDIYVAGIMEHIEEAGVHSGDSACSLPAYSLGDDIIKELANQTRILAAALKVCGLMNVQFAVQGDQIFILEVNPRASRTAPFVAKATHVPIAAIAARLMAGETLASFKLTERLSLPYFAVKESVFPFRRFPKVDVLLGPEMKSTGEVMGIDKNFELAFAKSQLAAGVKFPQSGRIYISVADHHKQAIIPLATKLAGLGFDLGASQGTGDALIEAGLEVKIYNKVYEMHPHIGDAMINGEIAIMFNTTSGAKSQENSAQMRQEALRRSVPYYTTLSGIKALTGALSAHIKDGLDVVSIQSYAKQLDK